MLAKLIKGDINKQDRKESGFTIVEVMIVLAIASLILAIVFIAVPPLQTSGRNNSRRSDLTGLRAQFDTWIANNGSKLPRDTGTDDLNSIVGSTGWGHYNGNDDEPGVLVIGTKGSTLHPAMKVATAPTRPAGPADITNATKGEYAIIYGRDSTDAKLETFTLPNRQEIHVWGEMECAVTILAGGNDVDKGGAAKYAASHGDVKESNARALAFVYQIEGEDKARCEDNI